VKLDWSGGGLCQKQFEGGPGWSRVSTSISQQGVGVTFA
jgi:hypothetical protein